MVAAFCSYRVLFQHKSTQSWDKCQMHSGQLGQESVCTMCMVGIRACSVTNTTQWYHVLLYKHQWNSRWSLARKHDIFPRENNVLSSHVKRWPLLWLHKKSHLSQRNWNRLQFIAWRHEISLLVLTIISRVSKAQSTHEIFFNTQWEISYLRAAL